MYNVNTPPLGELPSSRTLIRSTLIAAGTAIVLLITVVLPAEYGVDPTGVGRVLGLTQMGEIKMALAEEAAAAEAAEAAILAGQSLPGSSLPVGADAEVSVVEVPAGDDLRLRSDSTSFTLTPGQGAEIKLAMDEAARVTYRWSVQGGVVNHDTHGNPVNSPAGFYHGYSRGTAMQADEGELIAAFDGTHGWFWRNRGAELVTVTLEVSGAYLEMRRTQ